jgi:hypothetical protein
VTPPIVSTSDRSNPEGDEKTIEHEQDVVGDVVGMVRALKRISEVLVNFLD